MIFVRLVHTSKTNIYDINCRIKTKKLMKFLNFQKVNEKIQVINDYEAGRGIPNQMVIGKIERSLGIRLRGKERGQALPAPTPSSKK